MSAPGPYQVQAAIAQVHATALRPEGTDWREIVQLYEALMEMAPSPVVALNHAVAVAMSEGPAAGLLLMDDLGESKELDDYQWYAAALDLHWPDPGSSARRVETLRRLTESTPCFELGIDRSAGVDAVVEDILGALP